MGRSVLWDIKREFVDMLSLTLSSKAAKSLSSPSCFRSRA